MLQTVFRLTRYGERVAHKQVAGVANHLRESQRFSLNGSIEHMKGLFAPLVLFAVALSLCSCGGSKYEDSFHIRSWEENLLNGDRALQRKEFAQAVTDFESAVTEARALPRTDMRLAIALDELGSAHYAVNDYSKASDTLKEALAAYENVTPSSKESISVLEDGVAKTCTTLGVILLRLGSTDEANKLFSKALSIYEHQQKESGPSALVRRELFKVLIELADIDFQRREYASAEDRYQQSLTLLPTTVGVRQYERRLVTNYRKLLKLQNKSDEKLMAAMSKQDVSLEAELTYDARLARSYVINRDYDKAEDLYLEAVQKAELLGEVNPELVKALAELSRVYVFKGNLDKAAVCLNRAAMLQKRIIGPADVQMHKLLKAIASLQIASKDYAKALDTLSMQWSVDQKLPEGDLTTRCKLQNRSKLALVLHKLGRERECDIAIKEAQELLKQTRQSIVAFQEIGSIYLDRGDFANAEILLKRLLKSARKKGAKLPGRLARALTAMATYYARQGKFDEAQPLYAEAIELMRSSPAMMRTSDYIQLVRDAASCLSSRPGHEDEARELLKETLGQVALPTMEDSEDASDIVVEAESMQLRRDKNKRNRSESAGGTQSGVPNENPGETQDTTREETKEERRARRRAAREAQLNSARP